MKCMPSSPRSAVRPPARPAIVLTTALLASCASNGTGNGTGAGPADIRTEVRAYRAGDVDCTGYLAWDAAREGPRPGVLIVHEWWGHNDYTRRRARMLAERGYAALAIDMYGDGQKAQHPGEAGEMAQAVLGDLDAAERRFAAAREVLAAHPACDPQRIAAIGYCFGGAVVLEMALRGEPLDAVASFHGALATRSEPQPDGVQARILVCHGGADQLVTGEHLQAFRQKMAAADVQWQLITWPDAQHGFTNPAADEKARQFGLPLGYDAEADAESWQELLEFLDETWR